MAYFVYILQSQRDGTYFIGYTNNLEERLKRHNEGRSVFTRPKVPWVVVYQENFVSRGEAMKRERELKLRKDREFISALVRASRSI
jgi:putative endonuclease